MAKPHTERNSSVRVLLLNVLLVARELFLMHVN